MDKEFTVLYTHQKTKKAKVWQDGILILLASQSRAILYDEKRSKLDALYVRPGQVDAGEELESDRYLIQVEDLKVTPQTGVAPTQVAGASSTAQEQPRLRRQIPSTLAAKNQASAPGLRIGLKRKRTGFIPPRQLKAPRPEVAPEEDEPCPTTALQVLAAQRASSSQPPLLPPTSGLHQNKPSLFNLHLPHSSSSHKPGHWPPHDNTSQARQALQPEGISQLSSKDSGSSSPIENQLRPPGSVCLNTNRQAIIGSELYERYVGREKIVVGNYCTGDDGGEDDKRDCFSVKNTKERNSHEGKHVATAGPEHVPVKCKSDHNENRVSDSAYGTGSPGLDSGDFMLSQDTQNSIATYNRVLSTINKQQGPSPWSMVGRKKQAPQENPSFGNKRIESKQGSNKIVGKLSAGDTGAIKTSNLSVRGGEARMTKDESALPLKRNTSQILALFGVGKQKTSSSAECTNQLSSVEGSNLSKLDLKVGQNKPDLESTIKTFNSFQQSEKALCSDREKASQEVMKKPEKEKRQQQQGEVGERVTLEDRWCESLQKRQEMDEGANADQKESQRAICKNRASVSFEGKPQESGMYWVGGSSCPSPMPVLITAAGTDSPWRGSYYSPGRSSDRKGDWRREEDQSDSTPSPALMDDDIKTDNRGGVLSCSERLTTKHPGVGSERQTILTPPTEGLVASSANLTPSPGKTVNEEACFEISFSPLSHASLSDEEDSCDEVNQDHEQIHQQITSGTASVSTWQEPVSTDEAGKTPGYGVCPQRFPQLEGGVNTTEELSNKRTDKTSKSSDNDTQHRGRSIEHTVTALFKPSFNPEAQELHCIAENSNYSQHEPAYLTGVNSYGMQHAPTITGLEADMLPSERPQGCITVGHSEEGSMDKLVNGGSNCTEASNDLCALEPQPKGFPAEGHMEADQINARGCSAGHEDAVHALATSNVRNVSCGTVGAGTSERALTDMPSVAGARVRGRLNTKQLNLSPVIHMTVMDVTRGERGRLAGEAIEEDDSLNKDGKLGESGAIGDRAEHHRWLQAARQTGIPPDHGPAQKATQAESNRLQQNDSISNGPHQRANPATHSSIHIDCDAAVTGQPSEAVCRARGDIIDTPRLNGQRATPAPAGTSALTWTSPSLKESDNQTADGHCEPKVEGPAWQSCCNEEEGRPGFSPKVTTDKTSHRGHLSLSESKPSPPQPPPLSALSNGRDQIYVRGSTKKCLNDDRSFKSPQVPASIPDDKNPDSARVPSCQTSQIMESPLINVRGLKSGEDRRMVANDGSSGEGRQWEEGSCEMVPSSQMSESECGGLNKEESKRGIRGWGSSEVSADSQRSKQSDSMKMSLSDLEFSPEIPITFAKSYIPPSPSSWLHSDKYTRSGRRNDEVTSSHTNTSSVGQQSIASANTNHLDPLTNKDTFDGAFDGPHFASNSARPGGGGNVEEWGRQGAWDSEAKWRPNAGDNDDDNDNNKVPSTRHLQSIFMEENAASYTSDSSSPDVDRENWDRKSLNNDDLPTQSSVSSTGLSLPRDKTNGISQTYVQSPSPGTNMTDGLHNNNGVPSTDDSFLGSIPDVSLLYEHSSDDDDNNDKGNHDNIPIYFKSQKFRHIQMGNVINRGRKKMSLKERMTPYIYSEEPEGEEGRGGGGTGGGPRIDSLYSDFNSNPGRGQTSSALPNATGASHDPYSTSGTGQRKPPDSHFNSAHPQTSRLDSVTARVAEARLIGRGAPSCRLGVSPPEQSLSQHKHTAHEAVINAWGWPPDCRTRLEGAPPRLPPAEVMSPISRVLASVTARRNPAQLQASHTVEGPADVGQRKESDAPEDIVNKKLDSYVFSGTQVSGTARRSESLPSALNACPPSEKSSQLTPSSPDLFTSEDGECSLYTYTIPGLHKYHQEKALSRQSPFLFNPVDAGPVAEPVLRDRDELAQVATCHNDSPGQEVPRHCPTGRLILEEEQQEELPTLPPPAGQQHVPSSNLQEEEEMRPASKPHPSPHQASNKPGPGYRRLNENIDCPLGARCQPSARNESPIVNGTMNSVAATPSIRTPLRCQPYQDPVVHTSYQSFSIASKLSTPPQVVPTDSTTPPGRKDNNTPGSHPKGGQLLCDHPSWLSATNSPDDLSFLDSPVRIPQRSVQGVRSQCLAPEKGGIGKGKPASLWRGMRYENDMLIRNDRGETLDPPPPDKAQFGRWTQKGSPLVIHQSLQVDHGNKADCSALPQLTMEADSAWESSQESSEVLYSQTDNSPEENSVTISPDRNTGGVSKWDVFKQEEEPHQGNSAYHGRFSPPSVSPAPHSAKHTMPVAMMDADSDTHAIAGDEWQDDIIIMTSQDNIFPKQHFSNFHEKQSCRPASGPHGVTAGTPLTGDTHFLQVDSMKSGKISPPLLPQYQVILEGEESPGPPAFFPDTPQPASFKTLPQGGVLGQKKNRPLAKGHMTKFRIPRPAGGAGVAREETSAGRSPAQFNVGNNQPSRATASLLPRPYGSREVNGICGELRFPGREEVELAVSLQRRAVIPPAFPSVASYQQSLIGAVKEHLNLILRELAGRYYSALSRVDTSNYQLGEEVGAAARLCQGQAASSTNPPCSHGIPSKIAQVKKQGANQGRFFFACASDRDKQCRFFKWADEARKSNTSSKEQVQLSAMKLSDGPSITTYLRGAGISFYCECQLLRKSPISHTGNIPQWMKKKMGLTDGDLEKKKWYLKLPRKESSKSYTKDDLWVVTQQFFCGKACTFLARSAFYGPNQSLELELEPLDRFSPSNWPNGTVCHAIHVGNATGELDCIRNLEEALHVSTLPILPYLINKIDPNQPGKHEGFTAPKMHVKTNFFVPGNMVDDVAREMVELHHLNEDQAIALLTVATMFATESGQLQPPITLIHGVFGAGKSYLLAVIILFLDRIFELNDSYTPGVPDPMKILISSTTNVAVDRILLGLLELGNDDFVRVGSVKKIAKPVLPYSVHATGSNNQELRDLQDMLKSEGITPSEKIHVRRSIDQHKKGVNKKRLDKVRIVGVTCAASSFQCLQNFQFPVVLLDECSQMTEPMSLLPVARFACQKLILVGDPKQLDPTIQGSEAAHKDGLEQTMFDRLLKMGHQAVLLRTQYRCHPLISAIPNVLFYNKQLRDGVTAADRPPLAPHWPALCFFDVSDGRERSASSSGSFYNEEEADLVVRLIAKLVDAGVESGNIGVITLYRAQQARIQQLLQGAESEQQSVQVSTVDAFQGGERGVIILSCVRTHSVGFIDSDKRTNVALSRAKHHLLIVGHRRNLTNNALWRKVIKYCLEAPGGMRKGEEFLLSLEDGVEDDGMETTVAPPTIFTSPTSEGSSSNIDLLNQPDDAIDEVGIDGGSEIDDSVIRRPNRRPTRSHIFQPEDFTHGISGGIDSDSSDDDLPSFS